MRRYLAPFDDAPSPSDAAHLLLATAQGLAVESSEIEVPIWIAAMVRPAWIEAIEDVPGVGLGSLERGLRTYLELSD